MLLGCKGQFVPKIVEGVKPHSFRAKRKDGRKWKVGDTIQFYENVRQPNMRKIRPDGVVKGVQDVKMQIIDHLFILDIDKRRIMGGSELIIKISERDGFTNWMEFVRFFIPEGKDYLIWEGQLVHWTDLKY